MCFFKAGSVHWFLWSRMLYSLVLYSVFCEAGCNWCLSQEHVGCTASSCTMWLIWWYFSLWLCPLFDAPLPYAKTRECLSLSLIFCRQLSLIYLDQLSLISIVSYHWFTLISYHWYTFIITDLPLFQSPLIYLSWRMIFSCVMRYNAYFRLRCKLQTFNFCKYAIIMIFCTCNISNKFAYFVSLKMSDFYPNVPSATLLVQGGNSQMTWPNMGLAPPR